MSRQGRAPFLAVPYHVPNDVLFDGDIALYAVYTRLVFMANYAEGKRKLKKQAFCLKRGQLVLCQRQLAVKIGVGREVIRRCLRHLVDNGKINQQTNPLGTVITIIDFDSLFGNKPTRQPTRQPTANPQPTQSEQGMKERKKEGGEQDARARAPDPPISPSAISQPASAGIEEWGRPSNPLPTTQNRSGANLEALVWASYADAFLRKLGASIEPLGNEMALCTQLVAVAGARAPELAAFYVRHPSRFYAEHTYDLALAVKDHVKLLRQMQIGVPPMQGHNGVLKKPRKLL